VGSITDIQANYWRGYVYSGQRKMRLAEKYWKQAVTTEVHDKEGMIYYAKSANRLAGALLLKGEYEATMKVAVPALERMADAGFKTGDAANEIAANMFYDDAGLNGMFAKVKKDFDGLKAEEGLKD
jgi:hypothetical protein